MLEGFGEIIKRNILTLIITIFLCAALIGANFWIESLLGRYYRFHVDVIFLAFFIAIFFFAVMSLTLEQNHFTSTVRAILPWLMALTLWISYTAVLWLLNEKDILDLFGISSYRSSWYVLWFQIVRIFQTIVIILGFFLVRFILMDILRVDSDDKQYKTPLFSSLQAVGSSAISAIALFMFVPTILMNGYPFFALILIFMFLFYHAYWNYGVFLRIFAKKGRSTWWTAFSVIQLITAIVFILLLIVIGSVLVKSIELRDMNKAFTLSMSMAMNFMVILQQYIWAIFIVGIIMVGSMNFFSKSITYRVIHWVAFIGLLYTVLLLISFNEAWFVTAIVTFIYGLIGCLYASWNRLIQWIVLGHAKPSDLE